MLFKSASRSGEPFIEALGFFIRIIYPVVGLVN
jgi:hypothetical protein